MSDDEFEQAATEREAAMTGLQPYQIRARRAVSSKLLHDIWKDSHGGVTPRSSLARLPQSEPRLVSGGTTPIRPPPGLDHIDRMCAEQDRVDRAAAMKVRIDTELAEAALSRRNPHKVVTEYNPYSRERMGFDDDE